MSTRKTPPQYKPSNQPEHFITLAVTPWLAPGEMIKVNVVGRECWNITQHSKRSRVCIEVEADLRDTGNDFIATSDGAEV